MFAHYMEFALALMHDWRMDSLAAALALAASLALHSAAPQPPKVCSALDFGGVAWPPALTADDRSALMIALNISGSFEGADAWANLSDNFDGQGVSLGLLNQNLGQGSLQPMLIRLRDRRPDVLTALVSPAHLSELLAMLARWQAASAGEASFGPLSALDEPTEKAALTAPNANKASVAWAVANLYAGKDFEPQWKRELTAVANSPEYVSIQIAAAADDHDRAAAAEAQTGVRELRAYLMLFDVAVQNGGLYPEDLSDYRAYVKKHPGADATARLEKLLELRLRHVRKRFAADVRARKRAIIRGLGTVHGGARNLPAEYCYDGAWPYR
jgi:hypothetical protein